MLLVRRRWIDLPFLNLRLSWFALGLFLTALASLAPRLEGCDFGLPYLHHWDEPFLLTPALRVIRNNDLNPHFWQWPTLPHYLHAVRGTFSLSGAMSRGEIENVFAIRSGDDTLYKWDCPYPFFYENGRRLTAIFGAMTVVLAGLVARRIAGPWAGIASAALLAGYSPHLLHSHFATPEVPAVFFVLLAAWISLGLFARPPSAGRYFVCGLFCGLCVATKYNMYPVVLVPLVLHLFNTRRRRFWGVPLAASILGVPLGFLAGCPMALSDPLMFIHGLSSQFSRFLTGAHGGGHVASAGEALGKYLREAWQGGRGAPILIFAMLGVVPARGFGWRKGLAVWVFCIAYVALMTRQKVYFPRYALPCLALLLVPAGCGIASIARRLGGRRLGVRTGLVVVLLVLCIAPQIGPYRREMAALRQPDSRLDMARWIDANIREDAVIAVARELHFAPQTLDSRFRLVPFNHLGAAWSKLQESGAEYILTSDRYALFFAQDKEELLDDYHARFARTELVQSFSNGNFYLDVYNHNGNVVLRRTPTTDPTPSRQTEDKTVFALGMNPTRDVGIGDGAGVVFLEPGSLVTRIGLPSSASRVVLHARRGHPRDKTNPGNGFIAVHLLNIADREQVLSSQPIKIFAEYRKEFSAPFEVPAGDYLMEVRCDDGGSRVPVELDWVRFE